MSPAITEHVVGADHPAFEGHFVDSPVLPGVVLLTMVMEAVAAHAEMAALLGANPRIDQVKWFAPVGPGQRLRLELSVRGAGIDFELYRDSVAITKGRLSCPA